MTVWPWVEPPILTHDVLTVLGWSGQLGPLFLDMRKLRLRDYGTCPRLQTDKWQRQNLNTIRQTLAFSVSVQSDI